MRRPILNLLIPTLGLACSTPVDSPQPSTPEAASTAASDAGVAAAPDSRAPSPQNTSIAPRADTSTAGPGALGGGTTTSPDAAAQTGPDSSSSVGGVAGGTTGAVGAGSFGNPPPGCRDGGALYTGWIVDDQTFVLTNTTQPCGSAASAATRNPDDCAFNLSFITYHVPTLGRAGTYQLGRDASATIERQLPIAYDMVAGCRCLPSIDKPKPIESGAIKVTPNNAGGVDVEVPLEVGAIISSRLARCTK